MNKYLHIINLRTLAITVLCVVVTYFCIEFDFRFNIDITLFSIAVIFPLVFTIREAFKRRDNALKYLSVFKSSMNAMYHCFENNKKIDEQMKAKIRGDLLATSNLFFEALRSRDTNVESVRRELNGIFEFVNSHQDQISYNLAVKIYRLLKDTQESIENVFGLKMHGTPVSLRAYCLVFVYVFPFIYIPAIAYNLGNTADWVIYALAIVHGFILISLYNVQSDMEDPFDQVGLDDIHLEEFQFMDVANYKKPPE